MYTALQLIKEQLETSRETFEGTTADITDEQLHTDPGGKALPLGATYAHLLFSEDTIVQGMLQGKKPLSETTWLGKTGASEPMPPMDANWSEANEKWSKSVRINLPQMREYAKAVFSSTSEYVNNLKEEELDQERDLGPMGKKKVIYILYEYVISHMNSLTGEISVLKGIQGAKGYPF
jgi:hypothetical protein